MDEDTAHLKSLRDSVDPEFLEVLLQALSALATSRRWPPSGGSYESGQSVRVLNVCLRLTHTFVKSLRPYRIYSKPSTNSLAFIVEHLSG
jgi:hypothetical protein